MNLKYILSKLSDDELKIIKEDIDYILMRRKPKDYTHLLDLDVSARTYYSLKSRGIHYLEQLPDYSVRDLMSIKNFGKMALGEIETLLDNRGLKLKEQS